MSTPILIAIVPIANRNWSVNSFGISVWMVRFGWWVPYCDTKKRVRGKICQNSYFGLRNVQFPTETGYLPNRNWSADGFSLGMVRFAGVM